MVGIKLNKSNNNPFYGMKNCLELFNKASNGNINTSLLDQCWAECSGTQEGKEMFFSLLFSIGDITNRHHNIFGKAKIDNGGNANRNAFDTVMNWIWHAKPSQFAQFLQAGLFNQYQCFDTLFKNRIKTYKSKVVSVSSVFLDDAYCQVLLPYVIKIIKGNSTFDKLLVAKFLTLPRLSKRKGHKKMLDETKHIMDAKCKFLIALSKEMHWAYEVKGNICNFKGYRKWRKLYNTNLESVLFSTGKINEFDEAQFLQWFDQLPAQARFRVKNRILYSKKDEQPKWAKFQDWLKHWETYKAEKQKEQRILEEKIRQGVATTEDKIKLEKVKKEAKVTTGATNFTELYNQICRGSVDELKLESFIQNKVNLPYNSLVIIDDSGSMGGKPFNFAKFIASVCLVKNPDDDARNLIGFFSNISHWHSFIDKQGVRPNSLLRTTVAQTNTTPLVDGNLSFYENYQRISKFCDAVYHSGGTRLNAIPLGLEIVIRENPEMLDELKKYPVWTICSDGDLNSSWNARESMLDFQSECKRILGYVPFVVMIEITNYGSPKTSSFEGLENMIYIPANPAQIEQFLCNFKDMDIFDVYTPLQSIHRSNRYELIRRNVL